MVGVAEPRRLEVVGAEPVLGISTAPVDELVRHSAVAQQAADDVEFMLRRVDP
ncbi:MULTISPECIES: hypothetical protein [Streptomyces]|uniref:hypothetical protein n=1 Tax=Streptomyces TaxID=1883 RepID=UPI001F52B239|nr:MULTISPECIES: hypothetical protein [Streptomyces]